MSRHRQRPARRAPRRAPSDTRTSRERTQQRTAATYSRFSSDHQSDTSIADQEFAQRRYAKDHDFLILEDHMYSDSGVSGALRDRDGLSALMAAAAQGAFDAVLVYDFSRLGRDLHHLLGFVKRLAALDIGVWSVIDGINTLDPTTILHFQIQGAFAEHQLNELSIRTKRGQLGQRRRNSFVGEVIFGFESFRSTVSSVDSASTAGHGLVLMRPKPEQALVVQDVFRKFADGMSMAGIAKALNRDGIPGRYKTSKGWVDSTIKHMLANEKYIGIWIWNRKRANVVVSRTPNPNGAVL